MYTHNASSLNKNCRFTALKLIFTAHVTCYIHFSVTCLQNNCSTIINFIEQIMEHKVNLVGEFDVKMVIILKLKISCINFVSTQCTK